MHDDGILTLPLQAIKGRRTTASRIGATGSRATRRDAFDDGWGEQADGAGPVAAPRTQVNLGRTRAAPCVPTTSPDILLRASP